MRFCITSADGEQLTMPHMSCIDFPVNYLIENYTGKSTLDGALAAGGWNHEHKMWLNCGQPFGIRFDNHTYSLALINDLESRFGMVLTADATNGEGETYLIVHEQWSMHPLLLHTFLLMARLGAKSGYMEGAGWRHITAWARRSRYDNDGTFLLNYPRAYTLLRRLLSKKVRRKLDMRKIPADTMEGYNYTQNHSYSGFKTFVSTVSHGKNYRTDFTHATMEQALEVCGYAETT